MFIAKVIGTVWATRKHRSLENTRLLLIKPIEPLNGNFLPDEPILAVDKFIDAGLGNVVLVMDEGNSARQILNDPTAPIRTVICGIVDHVSTNKTIKKYH